MLLGYSLRNIGNVKLTVVDSVLLVSGVTASGYAINRLVVFKLGPFAWIPWLGMIVAAAGRYFQI